MHSDNHCSKPERLHDRSIREDYVVMSDRKRGRATASSLPNSAAMTSELQHHEPVPRKDRAVPLECTECRARYIAVLSDDPPDWKPHCIECDTPFGPVRGRAVYSLFAVSD